MMDMTARRVDFVEGAVGARKRLVGSMRQAGIVAAAGIVALGCMIERLAEDGRRARVLCQELGQIDGVAASQAPRSAGAAETDRLQPYPGAGGRQRRAAGRELNGG